MCGISNKKKRVVQKRIRQELFLNAGQLADEMNLRLFLWQEQEEQILFVESVTVTDIRFAEEKGMRWRDKVFSEDIVNGGRQQELDLAKAISVAWLAPIHCMIECTPQEKLAGGIPFLFDSVIGGPLSAPLFMFAMGIGMVYTGDNTPWKYVRRGIRIAITGCLLNVCRFLIPFLAGYGITGDYGKYIAPLPYRVLGNDILQFAALAMLLTALAVRLRIPDRVLFLICLGMSLLGTRLGGTDLGSTGGNIFMGYLIGTEDAAGMVVSDFPVLNWLIVPVSGYLFGKRLLHVKDKRRFYGFFSTAGTVAAAVWFAAGISGRRGMFGEGQNCYYHISTADCLMSIAAAAGTLGICYAVVRYLPRKVMTRVSEISRNVNATYCIQWVLVILCTNLMLYILQGTQVLTVSRTLLLGGGVSAASILFACFFAGRFRRRPFSKGRP